ncbi:hypothetical protein GCM10023187_50170 [Nibrella viscosa]|uniref:Uncharacterized protein n=1 Tax=Nibrella viscosa TaxID=1084524 RepID=A0ABP8KVM7_9BACT
MYVHLNGKLKVTLKPASAETLYVSRTRDFKATPSDLQTMTLKETSW